MGSELGSGLRFRVRVRARATVMGQGQGQRQGQEVTHLPVVEVGGDELGVGPHEQRVLVALEVGVDHAAVLCLFLPR